MWHRYGLAPEGAQAYLDAGVPKGETDVCARYGLSPEKAVTICRAGTEYFDGPPSSCVHYFHDAQDPAAAIADYATRYLRAFGEDTNLDPSQIAGIRDAVNEFRECGGKVTVDLPSETRRQIKLDDSFAITITKADTDSPVLWHSVYRDPLAAEQGIRWRTERLRADAGH